VLLKEMGMAESRQMTVDLASSKRTIDTAIRIGLLALLVYWCILIFRPFLIPVLWAIIIAVAIHPLYVRCESLLGGKQKLALSLFTLVALAILMIPTVLLASSMVDTVQYIAKGLAEGTLRVPPPPDRVASWPLVGAKVYAFWGAASENVMATAEQYAPQLKMARMWLLSTAAGAGTGLLQFILAILIAVAMLAKAQGAYQFTRALAVRLVGARGEDFAALAIATMRSVAQGVLGVALIQAILAGIGMLVMGVPGAGLWALLVLLLAVVQLPPLLILGPIMIYVFASAATVPAVLFMIWGILVSVSDAFLKPMLLGRGVDVPMLVILIGAIGGMMSSGIIGLFVGAVILALGYKLFMAWLTQDLDAEAGELALGEREARG
jgi:predicted PurR-regulated permease PerM